MKRSRTVTLAAALALIAMLSACGAAEQICVTRPLQKAFERDLRSCCHEAERHPAVLP